MICATPERLKSLAGAAGYANALTPFSPPGCAVAGASRTLP
jgi:hypothetical protein